MNPIIKHVEKDINIKKLYRETKLVLEQLDRIEIFENLLEFHFSGDMPEDCCDLILKSHDGVIYPIKLTGRFDTSELANIDFNIQNLQKQRIITDGELRTINYYREFNDNTGIYSDLVVKETRRYIRQAPLGILRHRLMNIYWYDENNKVCHEVINRKKSYSPEESLDELRERRKNILNEVKIFINWALISTFGEVKGFTNAIEFLSLMKNEIDHYLNGNGYFLEQAIQNCNLSYVTADMKKYILSKIIYNYVSSD